MQTPWLRRWILDIDHDANAVRNRCSHTTIARYRIFGRSKRDVLQVPEHNIAAFEDIVGTPETTAIVALFAKPDRHQELHGNPVPISTLAIQSCPGELSAVTAKCKKLTPGRKVETGRCSIPSLCVFAPLATLCSLLSDNPERPRHDRLPSCDDASNHRSRFSCRF